jgi:hypothetical protein
VRACGVVCWVLCDSHVVRGVIWGRVFFGVCARTSADRCCLVLQAARALVGWIWLLLLLFCSLHCLVATRLALAQGVARKPRTLCLLLTTDRGPQHRATNLLHAGLLMAVTGIFTGTRGPDNGQLFRWAPPICRTGSSHAQLFCSNISLYSHSL